MSWLIAASVFPSAGPALAVPAPAVPGLAVDGLALPIKQLNNQYLTSMLLLFGHGEEKQDDDEDDSDNNERDDPPGESSSVLLVITNFGKVGLVWPALFLSSGTGCNSSVGCCVSHS